MLFLRRTPPSFLENYNNDDDDYDDNDNDDNNNKHLEAKKLGGITPYPGDPLRSTLRINCGSGSIICGSICGSFNRHLNGYKDININ